MGRPTRCSPDLAERIAARIEAEDEPMLPEAAANAEGVPTATFYDWCRWGREGKGPPYSEFSSRIIRAREVLKQRMFQSVYNGEMPAGKYPPIKDWRARMTLLERMFPDQFGQTVQVKQKVEGELSAALHRLKDQLDEDTYERVLAVLAGDVSQEGAEEAPGDSVH